MQCYKHLESTLKNSFFTVFFSVPIEENTHWYFPSKHDNIKGRAFHFLFFCLWELDAKPLRFIARDIGRGSQRPRAGPLRVWARLAKTKTWECLAFLCLQTSSSPADLQTTPSALPPTSLVRLCEEAAALPRLPALICVIVLRGEVTCEVHASVAFRRGGLRAAVCQQPDFVKLSGPRFANTCQSSQFSFIHARRQ